jgi:hypothetical protein
MRDTNRAAARGMAAIHKEVVAGAEFAMAQHLRPHGMELALQIRGECNALLPISREGRCRFNAC